MANPSTSAAALLASLPDLEASLEPLHRKEWSETLESLSTIDRAKMDVLLSYAINDLIWVYLKLKGIDPSTHGVTEELDRIKTYYTKISAAENPEQKRGSSIDKAAARRFITGAIPLSQRSLPSSSAAGLAASQAREAVEEQGGRMDKRFQFIAKDTETERFSSGSQDDEDDGDVGEDGLNRGKGILESEAAPEASMLGGSEEVEEFMKTFEDDIRNQTTPPGGDIHQLDSVSVAEGDDNAVEDRPKKKKRRNQRKDKAAK